MNTPSIIDWRSAIISPLGPPKYTMRLLLLALAALMDVGGCPVQVTNLELCTATKLGESWLVRLMRQLEDLGWFARRRGPGVGGAYLYTPRIPPLRDVQKFVQRGTSVAVALA